MEVRSSFVEYTLDHWDDQRCVLEIYSEGQYTVLQEYSKIISKFGEYGFSKMLLVDISIYKLEGGSITLLQFNAATITQKRINLLFTGDRNSGNWDVLESLEKEVEDKEKINSENNEYEFQDDLSDLSGETSKKSKANIFSSDDSEYIPSNYSESETEFEQPSKEDSIKKKCLGKKTYPIDIGAWKMPSSFQKNKFGKTCNATMKKALADLMAFQVKCACSLKFNGKINHNLRDMTAYVICRHSHSQKFKFIVATRNLQQKL